MKRKEDELEKTNILSVFLIALVITGAIFAIGCMADWG